MRLRPLVSCVGEAKVAANHCGLRPYGRIGREVDESAAIRQRQKCQRQQRAHPGRETHSHHEVTLRRGLVPRAQFWSAGSDSGGFCAGLRGLSER